MVVGAGRVAARRSGGGMRDTFIAGRRLRRCGGTGLVPSRETLLTESLPDGTTVADAVTAMAATIYHWGLHPWAIYVLVALVFAFFTTVGPESIAIMTDTDQTGESALAWYGDIEARRR